MLPSNMQWILTMKIYTVAFLLVFSMTSQASCVVLLHGLARTSSSMEDLEKALVYEGFSVVNEGYPSREHSIETLADLAIRPALKLCPENMAVNFEVIKCETNFAVVKAFARSTHIKNEENKVQH